VLLLDLWPVSEIKLDEIILGSVLVLEEMILSEETQRCGVVLISDMSGLSFKQFCQGTPNRVLRILAVLQVLLINSIAFETELIISCAWSYRETTLCAAWVCTR